LPPWLDGKPGVNRSGYFNQYNQGKRSLALDLKQHEALDIAKRLVAASDVVCENFASGVMDRLGLGYGTLRQVNPRIIMISLSGYGLGGPESEFVSYGPAQVPLSGMSSLTGYAGWPPMHVGISYGDPTAGLHGAFAVLAALVHREKTGEGQFIDLSQTETTMALLAEGVMDYAMNGTQPQRNGNRDPHMAPHGVFRCAGEQRWVSIAVRDDTEWHRLALLIGGPDLAADTRFASARARKQNEDALEELITEWTTRQSPEAVHAALSADGIPAFTTFNNRDIAEDAHLKQSGIFVELDHAEVGKRSHIGMPWRLSATPTEVQRPAPCLGADTDDVMASLGYSSDEIQQLRDRKVLY
jgi:benzylsuccinate CoA-transferase BbsF subunit